MGNQEVVTGSTKGKEQQQESMNLLHSTQTVIKEALEKLGYPESMYELLKEPLRVLTVHRLSRATQRCRGSDQGRNPFPPGSYRG
jgi:hypothetical protein